MLIGVFFDKMEESDVLRGFDLDSIKVVIANNESLYDLKKEKKEK